MLRAACGTCDTGTVSAGVGGCAVTVLFTPVHTVLMGQATEERVDGTTIAAGYCMLACNMACKTAAGTNLAVGCSDLWQRRLA